MGTHQTQHKVLLKSEPWCESRGNQCDVQSPSSQTKDITELSDRRTKTDVEWEIRKLVHYTFQAQIN